MSVAKRDVLAADRTQEVTTRDSIKLRKVSFTYEGTSPTVQSLF